MSITPNPRQQRSIDALTSAFRAQQGEFTLAATEISGQLDMTILSPNQPLKLTITDDGQLTDIAFFDANEENCEADGTLTEGRWIDLEPDSAVAGALHEALATPETQAPPTAQELLDALSDQLLDLRDGASKKRITVTAEAAYERAAAMVRAVRDAIPTEPGAPKDPEIAPETSSADRVAPAELRSMIGLRKLPDVLVDEDLVEALALDFYWMRPELDSSKRAKAWGWASYDARNGHTGNAHRVLFALINGEDPYAVPFTGTPIMRAHVQAAEAMLAARQPKAA
ncbi:MAG TPA: hypothetical protein VF885_15225 [Arthrobacter sp.]